MWVGTRSAAGRIPAFGAVALAFGMMSAWAPSHSAGGWRSPKVLLVGTFHGKAGRYGTIQSAVNAARPGDWILVGPGDYKETADETGHLGNPDRGQMGGVYIGKSGITLRGMNRDTVIVDGTKTGSAPCSSEPGAQNYGAPGKGGAPVGRNGILVWKANDVSIENLTVCNFLAGTGASGNQIWWNGGAESGTIGLKGYWGSYLTATSTFFSNETTAAEYGIFASNSAGPAAWNQLYASNMNDSGTYVGACRQACDVTLDHLWMENNALGYSGTNSGGTIVIENSRFDGNQDGLDTNTQVAGDPPAPQNGRCPHGQTSPITRTRSCWVVIRNYFHDNNNPHTPAAGSAAAGPVGTGMTISGGRYDTVTGNTFSGNGAWGILFVPYAQQGKPSLHQTCKGSGGHEVTGFGCVLDPEGDALLHNAFRHNGYFGNPSNSDYGQITLFGHEPQNCFRGNKAPDGSAPKNLAKTQKTCGVTTKAGNTGGQLFFQVLCDTGLGTCPKGAHYPKPNGKVVLKRLPRGLPTMPDPCQGVPANPWCPRGTPGQARHHRPSATAGAPAPPAARTARKPQPAR
jgi:Right handed beta helix region